MIRVSVSQESDGTTTLRADSFYSSAGAGVLLVKQEVSRKLGLALTPEEEELRSKLEALYSKINAPTQFKGQLSELLSQIRMVKQEVAQKEVETYNMDEIVQDEVRQYLAMEQNGMAQLINIIQADMADLTTIKNGMMRMLQGN
uniref:(California timema) hypothetical protein n=1 Tax=Timema californicum TaxID=61474 RepID=A0A7R9PEF0_TIMCA|nr:unnamed protein product [Timema californicum]